MYDFLSVLIFQEENMRIEEFLSEAAVMKNIKNPNLVQLLGKMRPLTVAVTVILWNTLFDGMLLNWTHACASICTRLA